MDGVAFAVALYAGHANASFAVLLCRKFHGYALAVMPAAAQAPISLAALNALDCAAFTAAIGGALEHSPHFAERAWQRRPFASTDAVHAALLAEVAAAPEAER